MREGPIAIITTQFDPLWRWIIIPNECLKEWNSSLASGNIIPHAREAQDIPVQKPKTTRRFNLQEKLAYPPYLRIR